MDLPKYTQKIHDGLLMGVVGFAALGHFACSDVKNNTTYHGMELKAIECESYLAGGDVRIPGRRCDVTIGSLDHKIRFSDSEMVEGRFEVGDLVDVVAYSNSHPDFLAGLDIYRSKPSQ